LLEQMKSEPLSRLPAYPREPGKFGYQLLDCAHRLERRRKRQLGDLAHLSLKHLGGPALGLSYRGQHQLTEELGVVVLEDSGIDCYRPHGAPAISGDLYHATAGGRFNGTGGQLRLELLKAALHLLAQLKQLLEICHAIG
jgi:hypothetical protein